jgi:signal recognition particle subunit SRP54
MFEGLSGRLGSVFDKLRGRHSISEADVNEAIREVRRALLEADVALDVVRSFSEKVKEKAVGAQVIKSVTSGQMVIKIVHDELVSMLGGEAEGINLIAAPPVTILMVGLQGSGKTTTTAKLARRLTEREKKKVLMASLDTRRPAAMEQLALLGQQTGVKALPIIAGQSAVQITRRAQEAAQLGSYDVLLLDTAGRTTVDDELMGEAAEVKRIASPHEVILVADSLTGQDAVNTARAFDSIVGITGIALTRLDGDGRGGAALSMRAVTGKPIKLIGTGEKLDGLDEFNPERIASRILGMGDVVALVEKAAASIDAEKAAATAEKMRKGLFDLADLRDQLLQMQTMGGMGGIMALLPGMAGMKDKLGAAGMGDEVLTKQVAIINSMTPFERRNPELLKASRKRRIAAGSGTKPEDINKLLKLHRQMSDVMKMMGGKKGGKLGGLAKMFGLGGMPQMPSPDMLKNMPESGGGLPPFPGGGLPPGFPGGLPGGFPGLGPKLPGLGGLPGFGRKKK